MSGESVLFEILVEKKILEQLLIDNENFKETYGKLNKLEENMKSVKEENNILKQEIEKYKLNEKQLLDENLRLETIVKDLEKVKKLFDGKIDSQELEGIQSKVLSMKLLKMEREKAEIIMDFEKEKKILEELLKDNSKLKKLDEELTKSQSECSDLTIELKKAKKLLLKKDADNRRLDEENLNFETQIAALQKKIRLYEEEDISNNLEEVENRLLRLKLKNLESEKSYLMDDIERERRLLNAQTKPRMARVEENLKLLRKWVEKEMKERGVKARVSEEEKKLQDKITVLEREKKDLIEGFEIERRVFRRVLKGDEN